MNRTQFETVLEYIRSGCQDGASLRCGGHRWGQNRIFYPTDSLRWRTDDMKIARKEVHSREEKLMRKKRFESEGGKLTLGLTRVSGIVRVDFRTCSKYFAVWDFARGYRSRQSNRLRTGGIHFHAWHQRRNDICTASSHWNSMVEKVPIRLSHY